MSGEDALASAVQDVRAEVLAAPRDPSQTRADVSEMRARLAEARKSAGPLDMRAGPGRLQDIDLLAQTGALLAGAEPRETDAQLAAGAQALGLHASEVDHLRNTYALMWEVHCAHRLLNASATAEQGAGAKRFLTSVSGFDSLDALVEHIDDAATKTAAIIDRALRART